MKVKLNKKLRTTNPIFAIVQKQINSLKRSFIVLVKIHRKQNLQFKFHYFPIYGGGQK